MLTRIFTGIGIGISLASTAVVLAYDRSDLYLKEARPSEGIFTGSGGDLNIIAILQLIESILLKGLLPLVLVGSSLYIAYLLLTAEGDESKMKQAWKGITYSVIGLVAIAVSYAVIEIILQLQFN